MSAQDAPRDRAGVERELGDLVVQVSGLDQGSFQAGTDLLAEAGLDSLTALRIVAAAELRWDVVLPETQLADVRSVSTLADRILASLPGDPGP